MGYLRICTCETLAHCITTIIRTHKNAVILLPVHPASFAHKFFFQRVPASPVMQ